IGSAQAQTVQWTPSSGGTLPPNTVSTGLQPAGDICRLMVNGQVVPGELVGGACTVAGTAPETRRESFDILIGPMTLTWVQDSGPAGPPGAPGLPADRRAGPSGHPGAPDCGRALEHTASQ